jgi:hypothetical protein
VWGQGTGDRGARGKTGRQGVRKSGSEEIRVAWCEIEIHRRWIREGR